MLDLGEALDDSAVDAVMIASPNALHAERVTALARKVDRRLMVAHTMRYFPAMQEMRRRIATGAFTVHHLVGFFGLLRRTDVTSAGHRGPGPTTSCGISARTWWTWRSGSTAPGRHAP